jgi:hypothetical protein
LHSAKNINTEARSAGPGFVVTKGGYREQFDFVVSATGSTFEPSTLPGSRKPGVFVLDSPRTYADLGRARGTMAKAVVAGEGWRGLEVADRLAGPDREVRAFISSWEREGPSPEVLAVIQEAAQDRGVYLLGGRLDGALGTGKLEAVVAGGEVVPCDVLAFVPKRTPRVILTSASLGRAGGLLVDRGMKTTSPSIYAAGGCAELQGTSPPATLDCEASLSGRIAGLGCVGGRQRIGPARISEILLFGLRYSRLEMRRSPALLPGVRAQVVSRTWGKASACAIVFERSSRQVLSIETVIAAGSRTEMLSIECGASLQALAYGGLGSTDISMVSDTARLGLPIGQGADMRSR